MLPGSSKRRDIRDPPQALRGKPRYLAVLVRPTPPPVPRTSVSYIHVGRIASSRNGYSVHAPYMAATSRAGVLVDRLPQGGLDAICPLP